MSQKTAVLNALDEENVIDEKIVDCIVCNHKLVIMK